MPDNNGNACQQSQTWQNWAQTIEFQPACYFDPTTFDDLTNVLQQAQAQGKKVRVVGSGHSWSLGAVPGEAAYVPDAQVDAYLIDLNNMSPENCAQDAYLKAFFFKDAAGTNYVAVPPGTTQGWLAKNAANASGSNDCSNPHDAVALASMGPAPDITLGGFIANGCHGTGWEQPTVADLVYGFEIATIDVAGNVVTKAFTFNQELADILSQNGITKATPQASPDTLKALRASLGALGVITKLVFKAEPLFNVAHLDEYVAIDEIFPPNGDTTNLATLVMSCDYIEIFLFPYNTEVWVKRYKKTAAPPQFESHVVDFTWITSVMAKLTGGLLGGLFETIPWVMPLTLKVFFDALKLMMNRKLKAFDFDEDFDTASDPIVPVQNAYLYQLMYFTNLIDLSYTVPIVQSAASPSGYDFSKVLDAWNNATGEIATMQQNGQYPVSLNVHLRFIKNSDSFLSPANQASDTSHTCYIEFLSFSEQLQSFTDYSQIVGPEWASYGGYPHWAKMFQLVPTASGDAYTKLKNSGNLQPFTSLRDNLDPSRVFNNDFLNQLLNGTPSTTKKKKKTVKARPTAKAKAPAVSYPARQFQLADAHVLDNLQPGNGQPKSARGCSLTHDADAATAMLVDEHGHGHVLRYEHQPAEQKIAYELISSSQFLSPGEVFRRVGEILKSQSS